MHLVPESGDIYREYTGERVRIVTLAEEAGSGAALVVYSRESDGRVIAMPLSVFLEKTDASAGQAVRFRYVEEAREEASPQADVLSAFLDADDEARLEILEKNRGLLSAEQLSAMAEAMDLSPASSDANGLYREIGRTLALKLKYEKRRR